MTQPTIQPRSEQELAFLSAIHETPRDDTPRLVYADWLEEVGGQPELAEFIRLQCHNASLVVRRRRNGGWEIEDQTKADALVAPRLVALAQRHGDKWYRPYPRNHLTWQYTFNRGLPTVACQFYPSHAIRDTKAAQKRLSPQHHLNLHIFIDQNWLLPIPWKNPLFARAARLVVRPCQARSPTVLSAQAVHQFAALPQLSRYTEVMFGYVDRKIEDGLPSNFRMWDDGALAQRACMVVGHVYPPAH